ncbi:type-I membrane glycoprotein [Murmansk poxvirus]|uniref:Type-I membrane glycoprotein n=1 Tax=Murmansk poxvirus TaxID=2025359 RepID=A0A223FMZ2_9POXV|nr:type-I membrane glycoprotein [Murmansk poxvirus]AST09354.1 type-I membrane glycoprotein [Murmansk poxvirus]
MYSYAIIILLISHVNTLYILPTINDESDFCYGSLYFNWIGSDIKLKYEPVYKPPWYNFINMTSSINKLDDYYIFKRGIFIEYRYGPNIPISIEITTKLKINNNHCLANITCYINNFISDTTTVLSRMNSTHKYYPLTRSCIVPIGYNVETVKMTNYSIFNNYDIISVCILIFISIMVILYMIIDIKIEYIK